MQEIKVLMLLMAPVEEDYGKIQVNGQVTQ